MQSPATRFCVANRKMADEELSSLALAKDWAAFAQRWSEIPLHQQRDFRLLNWFLRLNAPPFAVELLLKAGCDLEEVTEGIYETTPLFYACEKSNADDEIVALLLRYGANVHAADTHGATCLHAACGAPENLRVVQLLLSNGSNANAEMGAGKRTPLMLACLAKRCQLEMVRLFLASGADVNQKDAAQQGPLLYALHNKLFPVAQELVMAGADVRETSPKSLNTALHMVASSLVEANKTPCYRVAKLLLERGAHIDALNAQGLTPLILACQTPWNFPMVELLLHFQADISISVNGPHGGLETAMTSTIAVLGRRSLEMLLQAGADPNERLNGIDMVSYAALRESDEITQLLVQAGASLTSYQPGHPKARPPLFLATQYRSKATVVWFLQYGANKRETIEGGYVPFDLAQSMQRDDLLPLLAFDKKLHHGIRAIKPPRLLEEEMQLNFTFSFCAQCRGDKKHDTLLTCGGCRIVAYCNAECQRAHWKQHKKICKQKQANDEMARTTDNCV